MKLAPEFAKLLPPHDLNQSTISHYLSQLYQDPDHSKKHEAYKNQNIINQESDTDTTLSQELAISHENRATKLIHELITLSNQKEFSDLSKHFKNISPGATRKSACHILEILEVLTYKFAHKLISNINYFNSKLYTSTFNACTDGALTSIQTLLQSTDSSLYSAKQDYFKHLALKFATNKLWYTKVIEVHVINTLLFFIQNDYNIIVPNDIYTNTIKQILQPISQNFQIFVYNNLHSRKGAYEFISCASNMHISKLEKYINSEFKYTQESPELTSIDDTAKECGLDISSLLDYEYKEGETICKLKQRVEEAIIIGLTAKLIKDDIIDYIPLIFTDITSSNEIIKHMVIQTPLGWYSVDYDGIKTPDNLDIETAEKLIDAKELYELTSDIFTNSLENHIHKNLRNKEHLSFDAALKSISNCPIQNPSTSDILFFMSDIGTMLSIAFSNTQELSSLTSEDISLWKDIATSKNNYTHLKISGEARFKRLIKTKLMDHNSIFKLMKTTEKSLLHIAVLIENPILVKLLLGHSYGATLLNPNIIDSNKNTAFHLALLGKNKDIINIFLHNIKAKNISTTIRNQDLKDVMHIAINTENINAIKCFLSNGYNLNTLDNFGNNILQYAINNFSIKVINLLIDHRYANILHKNLASQTALHLAASKKGAEDLIQTLHQKGCSTIDRDIAGDTPMHEAVLSGNLAAVKALLLLDNASVTYYNTDDLTPVMIAAYTDRLDILDFFLQEKSTKRIDINMLELLNCAIKSNSNIITIEMICNHINTSDINEELIYASLKYNDAPALIKLFWQKGVNYNITDLEKDTPLHMASYCHYDKAVTTLLSLPNINPNAQNIDGCTPFHLMTLSGKVVKNIAIGLLQAGANLNIKNNKGQTPRDILIEENPYNLQLLDNIISSHQSRKRSTNDISALLIQTPMVPEDREYKKPNTSTYFPDDVNISPVITNTSVLNNIITPDQQNHLPYLGKGL